MFLLLPCCGLVFVFIGLGFVLSRNPQLMTIGLGLGITTGVLDAICLCLMFYNDGGQFWHEFNVAPFPTLYGLAIASSPLWILGLEIVVYRKKSATLRQNKAFDVIPFNDSASDEPR